MIKCGMVLRSLSKLQKRNVNNGEVAWHSSHVMPNCDEEMKIQETIVFY